ncbi:DUF2878 domain-containing protein [Marinomonas balearica]|uniref:Uncharacterized protein DUF2878 n=1 Tax=Marinomonas balearica TaxID=491947 RepID=A0A4R6M3T8_9GAMM|nr:DUF2878 domain-containing protein [Marinomonas balearica]TDO95854.1 uncharacterized protein DUF2878 [Marinomonas balearica]
MKNIANAVGFQLLWFACVLLGDWAALLCTFLYLFFHRRYLQTSNAEFVLMIVFLVIGCLWDGLLIHLGVLVFPNDSLLFGVLPPLWLLCLWVSVATMLSHCLRFVAGRYLLATFLGFVSPVLSYIGGAALSDVEIGAPFELSVLMIAIGWAVILPLGFLLSQKLHLIPVSVHKGIKQ